MTRCFGLLSRARCLLEQRCDFLSVYQNPWWYICSPCCHLMDCSSSVATERAEQKGDVTLTFVDKSLLCVLPALCCGTKLMLERCISYADLTGKKWSCPHICQQRSWHKQSQWITCFSRQCPSHRSSLCMQIYVTCWFVSIVTPAPKWKMLHVLLSRVAHWIGLTS